MRFQDLPPSDKIALFAAHVAAKKANYPYYRDRWVVRFIRFLGSPYRFVKRLMNFLENKTP